MSKIILITGSRKGIGKSLCEYFLNEGDMVIGCSRGEQSIEHKNYSHYAIDVSDEKSVGSMVKAISKTFKKLDILINNAGIASMNHLLLTPGATAKRLMDTNFLGTFLFTREAAKLMKKNKFGRIVNFVTVATPLQLEGEAVYASSKAAVKNLTEISAKELSPFGITVNAIGPTPVETDLIKNVPKDKIDKLIDSQTVKRFGNINDIINVVSFFISPTSDFITGQTLYLGGIN